MVPCISRVMGDGVAVRPDTDDEEALGEVLDIAHGRKQHLLSTTIVLKSLKQ